MVTINAANNKTAATGKVLQGQGVGTASDFSTATYPSVATGTGKVLVADGTNWVASTPTFPNASATSGKIIQSDGTNWIASTPTYPATAGTSGKIHISDGTNIISSTPTYPNSATGTGTILRADGTNWVATTATYPATTTANQILYSSATSVVGEITGANNSILSTNGSGVPSLGTSLINDYTLTSSTAATVRTLTVTNTDNTNTASAALIKAVSGGASAGDAAFQASTTTTVWSLGVDNSVTSPTADPFVVSQGTALGTNNVISIATSGEINHPLQPAFLAYLASAALNKTGAGANYQLGTDALTEVFDQNSDFNTNGTFTAPVTGRYQLSTGCYFTGCTVATTFIVLLTTSNRVYRSQNGRGAGNGEMMMPISALADMDAADTATVTVNVAGEAGNTVDIGTDSAATMFGGFLAC